VSTFDQSTFIGLGGDTERFRRVLKVHEPQVDASLEAEEHEFDRRFEMRLAALGHPASRIERITIVKELQREMKKEKHRIVSE